MITIPTTPALLASVYQPIFFDVDSDKVNPELRVRCDLFARAGSTGAFLKIASKTEDKYQGNTYFRFNLHKFLNSMVEIGVPIANNGDVNEDTTSIIEYYCKFTELIFDANDLYIEADELDSDPYHAVNCVIQSQEPTVMEDFICDDNAARFLTDYQEIKTIYAGQTENLFFISDRTTVVKTQYITDAGGIGSMAIGSTFIIQ